MDAYVIVNSIDADTVRHRSRASVLVFRFAAMPPFTSVPRSTRTAAVTRWRPCCRAAMRGRRAAVLRRRSPVFRWRSPLLRWRSSMLRWRASVLRRWPSVVRRRDVGTWRRRMMLPARFIAVPRPVAVVTAPVASDGKGDDRKPDYGPVIHHWNIGALIRIAQAAAIGPATQVRRCHVAPCIAFDAAHHGDRDAAGQLRHRRIVVARAGIDDHRR